jgi:hypothetical protein
MLFHHPRLGVRNYATPANEELLNSFDSKVENYSIEDYQTPQVAEFCTRFLADNGFDTEFSFDPYDNDGNEPKHIQAYKCLRQGLRAFEYNGGCLDRIQKPLGAHNWILAQQVLKEQEQIEREGQRDDILVSEVETDDSDSENKGDSDGEEDDGLFINIDAAI